MEPNPPQGGQNAGAFSESLHEPRLNGGPEGIRTLVEFEFVPL